MKIKKKPAITDKNKDVVILSSWINRQKCIYKKKKEIMSNKIIYDKWTSFVTNQKYGQYFNDAMMSTDTKQIKKMDKPEPKIINKIKTNKLTTQKIQSNLSTHHQKYKTMNSNNLHTHFKENKDDWMEYHNISEENEKSFQKDTVPHKLVIEYLKNIPENRKKSNS